MDRIEGHSRDRTWETLSLFMQFRIACTLRCYVKQLHSFTSTLPGHDGIVSGDPFFCSEHGPFEDANTGLPRTAAGTSCVGAEGAAYGLAA